MDFQRSITVDVPFADAVDRVRSALADQGFGVITEIDLQATLRAKIGAEIQPYLIIGACNPTLAHQALQADPRVGVLLPCNVTVHTSAGQTHVQLLDPMIMTAFDGTEALAPVAAEAAHRLGNVLDALQTWQS